MSKKVEPLVISKAKLIEVFIACGFKNADKWSEWKPKKLLDKIEMLADLDEEQNLKEPKDKHLAELLADILEKVDQDGLDSISIVDKVEKKDKDGKKKKKGVKGKKFQKEDDEEDEDEDEDADEDEDGDEEEEDEDEDEDEDDEPKRKKKGKKMKDKKDKKDKKKKKERVEEAAPKKKKKKDKSESVKQSLKKKKGDKGEKTELDKFGLKKGSNNSELFKHLSKKPKTMSELRDEAGLEGGFYDILNKKAAEKVISKTKDNKYHLNK